MGDAGSRSAECVQGLQARGGGWVGCCDVNSMRWPRVGCLSLPQRRLEVPERAKGATVHLETLSGRCARMIGSETCQAEICGLHRGSRDTPQSPLVTFGDGMQRSKRGKVWSKDGEVGRTEPRQDSEDGAGTALRLAANAGPTSLKKPVFCRNMNDCEWPCC
ncbi:hypothetical protein LZ31DRAFT_89896 [Colletotrichum somersetense]|nr:hypothetical protein LZ31DRAFT_89896 [Colletotrichum somersetense]